MKLIIVTQYIKGYGGLQLVLLKIAQKYNAKIYTFNYEPETTFKEFKDIDVVNLGDLKANKLFTPRTGLKFLQMKIKEDYDVLNVHYPPAHWLANRNPRVLWYCHSPRKGIYLYSKSKSLVYRLMGFVYKVINKRVIKKIDCILANSKNVKERIESNLGVNAEVMYLGVDLKEFKNNGYKKYFFYPSRITRSKRMEYAIKAFNLFKKKNPSFELIIAGNLIERDCKYYEKLKKIHKGKILVNITPEEIKKLYAESYCVVFTPKDEDFGLIPIEGMSCSKPVIAVNDGGPKETVINGKTGFLVNSIKEMAEKMDYLAKNPSIVRKMGKAGREYVEKNFTWKQFFKNFDKVCKEVAKKK